MIELSSFFLIGGLLLIYLMAKSISEYILILQVVFIIGYLKIAKHILDLLNNILIFKCLFIFSCFMVGVIPIIISIFIDPIFEKPSLVIGVVITIANFYIYCSPKNLTKLGWMVKDGNVND